MQSAYRLKSQAEAELRAFKSRLASLVKFGLCSAESAMDSYLQACAQISRNAAAHEIDTREWSPLRCRDCGQTGSVPTGVMKYACSCSPTRAREAFLDMVGRDGSYLIGEAVALKPKDTSATRKQALIDGATLAEADALLA